MALEALKQAEKHTVGVKQTEKAVARQVAAVVYIASNADERVTGKIQYRLKTQKRCWKSAEPAA